MKLFKFATFAMLLCVIAGISFTSCSSSGDEPVREVYYNFATLVSATDGGIVVQAQKDSDSPVYTMTFTGVRADTTVVPVGSRLLVAYIPTDASTAYASGSPTLAGIWAVYTSKITEGDSESTSKWKTKAQPAVELWRTGKWINVQAMCTYKEIKPTTYDLVVDTSTLGEEYPTAYIIYDPYEGVGASTQTFYASFNIESVWAMPSVHGLNVIALVNGQSKTFKFDKAGYGSTPQN